VSVPILSHVADERDVKPFPVPSVPAEGPRFGLRRCFLARAIRKSFINRFVLAGLSGPLVAPDDSVSSLLACRASPVGVEEKSSSS
jgi:hypothetical protein